MSTAGLLLLALHLAADARTEPALRTVEELARDLKPSVVVVDSLGRDGEQRGVGTGFVVHPDGLVATNLHVVGEARPIRVTLSDGKVHAATAVHAFDRRLDLAVVKIDARGLPALPLADSDALQQGQEVVALGNPQGLEYSVVAGCFPPSGRSTAGRCCNWPSPSNRATAAARWSTAAAGSAAS